MTRFWCQEQLMKNYLELLRIAKYRNCTLSWIYTLSLKWWHYSEQLTRSLNRFESQVVPSGRDHSSLAPLVTCLTLLGLQPWAVIEKVGPLIWRQINYKILSQLHKLLELIAASSAFVCKIGQDLRQGSENATTMLLPRIWYFLGQVQEAMQAWWQES